MSTGSTMGEDEAPDPKPSRRDKAALPFAEDAEKLDGRAWNRKPLVVLGVILAVAIAVVLIVLALRDVTSEDDDDGGDNVPPAPITTTTTTPPTTTTSSTTTTSTTAPPPVTTIPTNTCSPEEGDPDCIDPDGDGFYELIVGGGSCLNTAETPRDCIDTDNDGVAGPPAAAD